MKSQDLNYPIVSKHHVCWGQDGVAWYGAFFSAIVIVDVLSFCTTVDIALSKECSIIPTSLKDETQLLALAEKQGAILAKKRIGKLNSFFGKKHSEEYKRNASEIRKGIPNLNCSIPVVINDVFYNSVQEASKVLKVPSITLRHRVRSPNKKFVGYNYAKQSPTTIETTQE